MDPAGLASAVTLMLAPYIAKAGEKLAEKAGEQLSGQLGRLWGAVSEKLKGKAAAEEAAKDFVAAPLDEDNQAAFRTQLKKVLSENSEFGQQLLLLLQSAQAARTGSGDLFTGDHALKIESNYGTIVYGGDHVQNIGSQINDSTIGGDVTGGDKITSGE